MKFLLALSVLSNVFYSLQCFKIPSDVFFGKKNQNFILCDHFRTKIAMKNKFDYPSNILTCLFLKYCLLISFFRQKFFKTMYLSSYDRFPQTKPSHFREKLLVQKFISVFFFNDFFNIKNPLMFFSFEIFFRSLFLNILYCNKFLFYVHNIYLPMYKKFLLNVSVDTDFFVEKIYK